MISRSVQAQLVGSETVAHAIHLRDLLWQLVLRDLRVRYQGSVLGVLWSLAHPLLLLCTFYFLFQMVITIDIPRYSAFAFSGILVWTWFSSSVTQCAGVVIGNRDLIRKPGFPVAILPVVTVTSTLVNFAFAVPVLFLLVLAEGGALHASLFFVPVIMIVQYLLCLGLGYLLAAVNVLFRDTQHIVAAMLQILFFLTPIFYDPSVVPDRFQGLYGLNPLVHLFEAYRDVLMRGNLPEIQAIVSLTALALVLLVVGVAHYRRVAYRFVEEL